MDKLNELESKNVIFTPINYLEFRITFPNANYKIKKKNITGKYLKYIAFNGIFIQIGDIFNLSSVGNLRYKVNEIALDHKHKNTIRCSESIYNKITQFVLPFVINRKQDSSYLRFATGVGYIGFLVNAYLNSPSKNIVSKNSIFLLMKYVNNNEYKNMEKILISNSCFVEANDISVNYVLYEFKVPKKFLKDFEKLKDGNYSGISSIAKNRIINFFGNSPEGSLMHGILNRSSDIVKQLEDELDVSMEGNELCSKFNEEEKLKIEML